MNMPNPTSTAPERRPRRTRGAWRRYLTWLVLAAIFVGIVFSLRPKPVVVETATIGTGPLTVSILEEGKTRIRHRFVISPPVAGLLNRIPHRAGARIEAGKTILATIQPQAPAFLDVRTQREAEARLRGAEAATLQRESQLQRARSALDLAEKEKTRVRSLIKSGVVAAREWDAAENQVEILARELRSAEFGLQVAEFERAQAEAALTQAQGPQENSGKAVEVIAPVDGFVLNVYEESAKVVAPGLPLMEVGSPSDLEAEIEMLSSDAVAVSPGARVTIEHWGGETPLPGTVTMIEPGGFTKISALGVEEQRVRVRVDFTLPEGKMLGDRYRVEARVITWHSDSVLQIPTGALFRRGADWRTFVYAGGKAQERTVQIAHNNGTAAEIQSGLKQGDTVVLHPPDVIVDGAEVTPRATK